MLIEFEETEASCRHDSDGLHLEKSDSMRAVWNDQHLRDVQKTCEAGKRVFELYLWLPWVSQAGYPGHTCSTAAALAARIRERAADRRSRSKADADWSQDLEPRSYIDITSTAATGLTCATALTPAWCNFSVDTNDACVCLGLHRREASGRLEFRYKHKLQAVGSCSGRLHLFLISE